MRLLSLLLLLLSINQSISQCITYPDSYEQYFIQSCAFNSSNNYATPITLSNWTLLDPTTYDDGYSRVRQPLPFPIWIYGVPWNWIYISVNSALFFGPTPISVTTLTIPVSNTYADAIPIIAALWTDLYWTSTDPAQKIVYATEGLPGSRQYIIRFERIRWLGTSTNPNLYASFDYIFYENRRGYFEIRYHAVTSTASSLNLGIQSYDDGGSSWSLYRSSTAWSQIKEDLEQRQLSFQFVGQSADNITCGGLGFNFNTLRGNDLSFTDVNNTRWIINPCGEVVESICSGTSSTEKAMICQIQLGAPYDLGVWGPNSARWQYPPDNSQGVEMVLQDGAYCSLIAGSRWTTVRFVCDATATTAQLVSAVEEATCVYRFTIRTSLACGGGVRQNTTEYARSSLASCNRVNGAGYFSSLCPRDRNNLVPLSLAAPTRILANVASGTSLIPINFPFFFYGRQFSQVYASMHGSLWFGASYTGIPSTFPTLGVAATAIDNFPAIIAFGTSMTGVAYAGFTAPNITYSSATIDGKRSLVIRYWGMKYTAYRGLYDMVISFDIILSEGEPGGVQIKYYEVTANPAVAVSIGVHGPDDMNNYAGYISGQLMTSAIANTLQGATLNLTYTGRLSTDGCTAFGVNFTNAITRDLTWTDGTSTYYINPCRALTTTNPCRPGTTVCQVVGGVGNVVSTFNPSSVMWSSGPNFGVRATMRDGTYCPAIGAARTLIVDWICSQSSTETYVVRAVETSTCVFNIQIFSPIACQSPASCRNIRNPLYNAALCPTAANTPRLALTNESQPLMVGIDDSAVRIRLPFTFWMYGLQYRYCWIGTNGVLALGLRGQEWAYYTFPVQGSNNDALPLIAPLWTDLNPVDSSRITYSNEIINGSRAFVVRYSNVEYFGNVVAGVADTVSFDVIMFEGLTGNMEFRYYGLSAGSYADPVPLVVGIQADDEENFVAVYNGVTVDNAVAASLSNTTLKLSYTGEDQSSAACGGLGYNLTSLSGSDLVWNGTPGQQITVRVCGTVADRQCSESSFGDRSMVCQEVLDANNVTSAIYMVSEWKPKAVYYSYPSARSTGVMMINQDGAWCDAAGMPRVVVMDFMCDTTATQARITSWSEPQICVYVVNITTNAVCGPGARGTVLPNPYPMNSTLTSCVQFRGQSYDASWCPRSVNDTYYWPEVFTPLGRILATDDGGVQLNFNFPFSLYGANEPTVILSSNGLLSFGYGWSSSPNAGPWPTMGFVTSDAYPMVAAFWTDLINIETTAGWIPYKGYVEYGRAGVAPNRRVIFRFKDVDYWATRNFLTERSASFDIVLWEGGLIETRFYTIDPAPTQTVLIGMHGYGEEYLPVANLAPLTREYAGQLSGSSIIYRYKGESLSDFCGGIPGGYNLTRLSFEDLNFNTTQYQYWLRPCGYVTARACTAFAATSMVSFCQGTLDGLSSTALAIDSAAAGSFSVIDSSTLRLSLSSGQMCAAINGPRRAIVDFICDPSATRSVLESVTENVACITVARVRSPFACAGPSTCRTIAGPLYNGRLCSGDPSMGRNILNPTNPTFIHPNNCDDCNGNYAIPFEMRVYGRAYSSVWISTNGWIGFGTAAVSSLSGSLPLSSTSAGALPVLTHMFADLANRNAYGNASISYSTEGDAPNRIFLIRYSWVTWLSYQDRPISIDIKLYEGAEGRIDVLYHKVTTSSNVATVGIQSSDGTSYTVVSNNPATIDSANLEGKMLRWYYTGSDASVNRTCGGLGYDFTSYMGTALSATQGATSVYFSPCSITSAPACLASPATDRSVACAVTGTSAINLGVYSPANNVWTYLSNGVQQYMPIGPWCEVSRGPGILFVNYLCNPSQTTPRMTNFTLTESNCVNQISIETSRACGGGNRNSDGSNSTKPIRSTLTACYTQVGWNVDARVCPRNTTDPFYTPIVQTSPTEILQRVDNAAANVQIPFPFYVYGTPYTELNITSDGLLTFGPGSTVGTANTFLGTMPIAENSWPVIAAFWSDLWNGGSPGELEYPGYIKWSIEGTPPTRKMVIRYYMLDYILYRWYPSVTGVSFDVFLHEGTAGNVDIHYYRVDPNPTTYVTLGMRANDRSTLAYTAVHNWELLTAERTNQLAGATVSFRYTGNAVATACGAFGLNLTSIRDIDMSYTNPSTGRTYYHRACGVVQAPVCRSAPVTEHSTLCETTGNTPLYSATQFNPASVTWTPIPNGIQSTQQTGTYCPTPLAAPRIAVIQYICNATANPPALRSVTVVDGCTYTAVVHTTAVCVGSSSSSTGVLPPSSSAARSSSTAAPSSSAAVVTSSARTSSTAAPSSTAVVPSSSAARVSSSSSPTNVVSSTASTTSSTQTQESSTGAFVEPTSSSSSALSDGAIAGIVIGVLVGALMFCVAIFFLCCATRGNKAQRLEDEKEHVEQSSTGEHNNETAEPEDGEVEMTEV